MMASKTSTIASFIEAAPPGELADVLTDIKSLTNNDASVLRGQEPALKKYNEEQFATVKLPGASKEVIVSPFNELKDGRYFDPESQCSFAFDHTTQKASGVQSYSLESSNSNLITSLSKALTTYTSEYYPASSSAVYPSENDSKIAIVLVANKYSPHNFWNGRWRSHYLLSSSSTTGTINVDVHYYEDGNVRLLTSKPTSMSASTSSSASEIIRQIASAEKKYQEDLNRAFTTMSEGTFKSLRRQLPVTRQKIEWERNVEGYRIGQLVAGGRSK